MASVPVVCARRRGEDRVRQQRRLSRGSSSQRERYSRYLRTRIKALIASIPMSWSLMGYRDARTAAGDSLSRQSKAMPWSYQSASFVACCRLILSEWFRASPKSRSSSQKRRRCDSPRITLWSLIWWAIWSLPSTNQRLDRFCWCRSWRRRRWGSCLRSRTERRKSSPRNYPKKIR